MDQLSAIHSAVQVGRTNNGSSLLSTAVQWPFQGSNVSRLHRDDMVKKEMFSEWDGKTQ